MIGDKLEVAEAFGENFQAIESEHGFCTGCSRFVSEKVCGKLGQMCVPSGRSDGKSVIWVKTKESIPLTLEQVRQKKKVLEQEVMALLNAFEEETGLRVKGINTSCAYQVNGTAHTYDLDIEVDFT